MTAANHDDLPSETLKPTEVREMTGCFRRGAQIEWLKRNGWVYFLNRAGMPIIGRHYARMRLAGIDPSNAAPPKDVGWQLDLSKVR